MTISSRSAAQKNLAETQVASLTVPPRWFSNPENHHETFSDAATLVPIWKEQMHYTNLQRRAMLANFGAPDQYTPLVSGLLVRTW